MHADRTALRTAAARAATLAALAALAASPAPAAGPQTVILVRHAEKLSSSGDPSLSDAGRRRAEALAQALRDVPLAAVFASPTKRTQETALPVALGHGLVPVVVEPKDVRARLATDHAGGKVLVVGHSNTLPDLVEALSAGDAPTIGEGEYDGMWIVVRCGEEARLLGLRYGPP
jgi:phosphohistidine phosphatase SixA